MTAPRPTRRPTPITPLVDALCLEFARRELTDDKLAETVAGWAHVQ